MVDCSEAELELVEGGENQALSSSERVSTISHGIAVETAATRFDSVTFTLSGSAKSNKTLQIFSSTILSDSGLRFPRAFDRYKN